ncbi:MAG: ATP-binding protein [Chitinophagaceae bacterium]
MEIQEQTFQNISREIHDNISLSLTLAKLHLHTLDWKSQETSREKVDSSILLITKSIVELRDISKSLDADIIIQHGLLKAIDEEVCRIRQVGLFTVHYQVNGIPVYMETQKELIIFRIIQESFNNIIKHAHAGNATLILHYYPEILTILVSDDGRGFDSALTETNKQSGLKNIETRIKILKGLLDIRSRVGKGTDLLFKIPYDEQGNN